MYEASFKASSMAQGRVELTKTNGMIFRHQTQMKHRQNNPNRTKENGRKQLWKSQYNP